MSLKDCEGVLTFLEAEGGLLIEGNVKLVNFIWCTG